MFSKIFNAIFSSRKEDGSLGHRPQTYGYDLDIVTIGQEGEKIHHHNTVRTPTIIQAVTIGDAASAAVPGSYLEKVTPKDD